MNRWVVVLALGLSLPGCDVGTAALLLSGGKNSSDSDPALAPSDSGPGFDEPIFVAWVAHIPNSGAADTEKVNLALANGNPVPAPAGPWRLSGPILNNDFFDPSGDGSDINAILIQVSSTQNFALDCVEVMDSDNTVIEYANGTTWSDLIQTDATSDPSYLLGKPDGRSAITQAVDFQRAFIFTLYSNPAGIPRFRVNGHGDSLPPNPGDTVAVGSYSSLVSERPGGMAIDTDGLIHVTLSVGDVGRLVRYNMTGAIPSPAANNNVEISDDLATAGSHAVALNSAGDVFTSCTVGSGTIQVRRLDSSLNTEDLVGFSSGLNNDRVEHNSITVDSDGDIVVVGGFNSLLSGRNHWRVKIPDTANSVTGTPIWQSSTSLDLNNATTYWHAVTAGANGSVFMTGDLGTTLFGGTIQVYSSEFDDGGTPVWEHEYQQQEVPSDVGHAIALDLNGNLYVAGSVGTDAGGKDGILLRYENATGTPIVERIPGGAGLDDEILDVAVDPADGSIFVVGYINVTGQGENIWVRKYVWDDDNNEFDVIWTRTHHGGFGNDRAVSCAVYQNNLVVAGYETNSTGQTKLVLRIYAK